MQIGQPILSDNARAVVKEHQGICFYGKITTFTDANNCKISGLSGYGDSFFTGYYIWCVRDAGGTGAAPQGECVCITSYTSIDGALVHNAFTVDLAVDDEVLLLHPAFVEAVGGGGGSSGDIEIFDSFEYPSDGALQAEWIAGGGAANPTRDNTTSYEGQYSMQSAVTVSAGSLRRTFPTRNMKTLANMGIASYSDVGGETIQFRLYDSSGNYSYWDLTLAAATTWKYHNINPHSTPTGDGGAPADLSDIVEIRLANLTVGSMFNFDFIKFSSLVATKIGIGYDGLDDNKEISSSVRGHLLAGLIHGTGIVIPDNKSLYELIALDRLDDAGHGLAALDNELGLIPQSGGATVWNATALQAIQDEAEDALEGEDLDHLLKLDGATHPYPENCATDSILAKIIAKGDPADPSTFDCTTDSLEAIADAIAAISVTGVHEVSDVVIYPVAEHAAATEITDDGTSPAYYADIESGTATAEGAPNVHWSEDIDFEQTGTINVISIFADLRWEHKTSAGTAYSKVQMSGDGGANWVDMTDSIAETDAAYQDKVRIGVGRFVSTITAGVNQLQFRLVSWEAGGATSSAKMRSDSYIRITSRRT